MIGKLKGLIDSLQDDHLIVDVSGVGYLVYCSAHTLRNLGAVGEAISVLTHLHVREDQMQLYGFINAQEKQWFLKLTQISGVGNKVAMAILSGLTPSQIQQAILTQDKSAFKPVTGVGPKLAQRILTELKDTIGSHLHISDMATSAVNISTNAPSELEDALSALANLGFAAHETRPALQQALEQDASLGVEALIKIGLQRSPA